MASPILLPLWGNLLDVAGWPLLLGKSGVGALSPNIYTRVDPDLIWSGERGAVSSAAEPALAVNSTGASTITWEAAGPLGFSFKLTGANDTSGDTSLTSNNANAKGGTNNWLMATWHFTAFPTSTTVKCRLQVGPLDNNAANTGGNPPDIAIDNNGRLWHTKSAQDPEGAGDVDTGIVLALNTTYILAHHGIWAVSGTQELKVYDSLGALHGTWTRSIDTTGVAAQNQIKFGPGGSGDHSGLVGYFKSCVLFKEVTTNPGPCVVKTHRPNGTVFAGSWTANDLTSLHAVTDDENADDGDTTHALSTTNNDLMRLDMTDGGPSGDDTIHAVRAYARVRAVTANVEVSLGVRQGAGSELVTQGTMTANGYNTLHQLVFLDPDGSIQWTPATADSATVLLRRGSNLTNVLHCSQVQLDVVYALDGV